MYSIFKLVFGGRDFYAVRCENRFETANDRLLFDNRQEMITAFRLCGKNPSGKEFCIDFDEAVMWCNGNSADVDCEKLNTCRRIACDIAKNPDNVSRIGTNSADVYRKLFLASRLKMSEHTAQTHSVHWSHNEIRCLKRALKNDILSAFSGYATPSRKSDTVKKTLYIPADTAEKIAHFAEAHGSTFNEFVIKSCLNEMEKQFFQ